MFSLYICICIFLYICTHVLFWRMSLVEKIRLIAIICDICGFVETNFCLNSPSRPWWIWANCLLHASYQLPVAQHHAWPIKNWQNWCGTANIDSWRFFWTVRGVSVANNQIVPDENTYGANPPGNLIWICCVGVFQESPSSLLSLFGTAPNSEAIENARGRPAHAQHTSEDHCSRVSFQSGSGVIWYVSVFQLIPLWIDRWLLKTCFLLFKSIFQKYYYIYIFTWYDIFLFMKNRRICVHVFCN